MRGDLPDGSHRQSVNLAHLGHREELAARPRTLARGLAVDPAGCGCIARDLEVILKCLAADCLALAEERLNLFTHQRVALQRGRVVRLVVPDVDPDPLRLVRGGKTAEAGAQLLDHEGEATVHRLASRAPPRRACRTFS